MAIGIGRMMGFLFPENFNNPYISSSITEFWRRWHMTLSRWMKNYLYLPLGGNRKGVKRTYFNLWTVFLLSGLWHGASWTFIIWGAYHGLFLVLERLFLNKYYAKIGRIPSIAITFIIAVFGWVLFRAESLDVALAYYGSMFSFNDGIHIPSVSLEFKATMILALLISFITVVPAIEKWQHNMVVNEKGSVVRIVLKTICAIFIFGFTLSMLTASGFNPFIYFRF
jgi:alginate O-acetyltransferase complex protein AlgI